MRLGLESLSPREASHASTIRHPPADSSHVSTCSPISVDDDSADDADAHFPRIQETAALVNRPSLLNLSFNNINYEIGTTGPRPLEQSSSERQDDTKEQSSKSVSKLKSTRPPFHVFLNTNPTTDKLRAKFRTGKSLLSKDERRDVISAPRTSICGKTFDHCELKFGRDRVQLMIWKDHKPRWQGDIKYAHIKHFCFSRVDRPPYILLLQLDNAKNRSDFATFYDPIFAKACEENDTKDQAISKVHGVVFYFDEVMDYMRCQSMADNNPTLANFFRETLSESEVRKYMSLDALRKSRYPRRSGTKHRLNFGAQGHSFAEMIGNGTRQALGSVSSVASFFRSTARPSVLEDIDNPSVVREDNNSKKGRTPNLSGNITEVSSPDSGEDKLPISIDDVGTEKQECGSGTEGGDETVVILHSPREQAGTETGIDDRTSFVKQNEKPSENMKGKSEAESSRQENERVKRRKIEIRRNAEMLEYPFDGSDKLGRIAVTLGDVDRLVPGEFLNDNIIDFYLRFLWRHLDSLQQQQMYFFTSHFFSQLNGTNGAHELSTADPDERFTRVARWTHKEANLFDKRFLFIPINDSFHWSLAVFCNPGSAIIKKHRKVKRRRVFTGTCSLDSSNVVDLVDSLGDDERLGALVPDRGSVDEEIKEEELKSCQEDRLAHPPCLLFLDSLRCHRKKKFTKMLRNYLECEYNARFASSSAGSMSMPKTVIGANGMDEQETIITVFDSDSIDLLEPNIPLQRNSSDCGVFLLMYAVSIVRLFPFGVTRGDLESNLISTLTPNMFRDEHVLEFREYLQQLLFCLQFLEKHGLPEQNNYSGLEPGGTLPKLHALLLVSQAYTTLVVDLNAAEIFS